MFPCTVLKHPKVQNPEWDQEIPKSVWVVSDTDLQNIDSHTDGGQSHKQTQDHPEQRRTAQDASRDPQSRGFLCWITAQLLLSDAQHLLQVVKHLWNKRREHVSAARRPVRRSEGRRWRSPHLDVELEGSDGLLQHAVPLLLRQLHAVHAAAVELFEQVGAGDAREGEERQTLAPLQAHGLLGDSTQDLTSRQVAEIPSVGVGDQKHGLFFANLEKNRQFNPLSPSASVKGGGGLNSASPQRSCNTPVSVCDSIFWWPRARRSCLSSPDHRRTPGLSRWTPAGPVQLGSRWVRHQDGCSSGPSPPPASGRSRTANSGEAGKPEENFWRSCTCHGNQTIHGMFCFQELKLQSWTRVEVLEFPGLGGYWKFIEVYFFHKYKWLTLYLFH